ncbi:nucleoside-diphosphate kinase [Candidatus Roizmanbacteria bacterium CG22_combo_CG10-13_8_21_14_all_33_16]|uniref:nucleoside-diphosphate kinase n=1 Tax=Candidatus Roizmanbacteria bacterium CG22_combo_CG10-13_8_21_14_all_33_16 TaxID=1974859 RepID=A0A2H0C2R2_9BACT|nr:MAG: nucleoside-diphosphate kinase [Candidatus Roizmanbacteria bacterium CG22_combo_CG10-13_8_21_14_all_33_16]
MTKQKALLIIKPDGVARGLCGAILKRFEQVGLTIIGLKFGMADEKTVVAHYPETDVWFEKVGQRTLTNYAEKSLDTKGIFKTDNAVEIGKTVKKWLIDYFQESPVLCVVVEGYNVIEIVRKLSGNTIPLLATPGTIRGDFSHDTIDLANEQNRPLRNIIHASDTVEDGEKEVRLWFKPEELFSSVRTDEKIMFKK